MIVFLLISIAAGLALWALLTETVLAGITALGVALASLSIIAAAAWIERRKREKARFDEGTASGNADDPNQRDTADQQGHREQAVADGAQDSEDDIGTPQNLQEPERTDERAPLQVAPIRDKNETTTVWIIPDRKRFHQHDCGSLADHDIEELTIEEAVDEGFTSCSLCRPDQKTIRTAG